MPGNQLLRPVVFHRYYLLTEASTFDNDRGSGEGSGGVDHNYYAGGGK